MKKTNKKYLAAIILGILCLTANISKAQISWPYPITNNLGCDIVVCYEVADQTCGPPVCEPCPAGGILIRAGGTVFLNGSNCTALPILDIHVVIMTVDGVAPSATCTAVGEPLSTCINSCGGTAITGLTIPAPSNCSSVSITYSGTGTTIF
jgi:hypothetical protein